MIAIDRSQHKPSTKFAEVSQIIHSQLTEMALFDMKMLVQMGPGKAIKMYRQFARLSITELGKVFLDKCVYCESRIDNLREAQLDHFRPVLSAASLGQEISPEHYWWLATEWRNLYLACRACSQHKANYFPLSDEQSERVSPTEALENDFNWLVDREQALLIDPCYDDPLSHLEFTENGEVTAKTEKGEVTITVLSLNRKELINARIEKWRRCTQLLDELAKKFSSTSRSLEASKAFKVEFSETSIHQAVARRVLIEHPDYSKFGDLISWASYDAGFQKEFQETAPKDSGSSEKSTPLLTEFESQTSTLLRVEIENFRALEQITLPMDSNRDFSFWHTLIGENGCGKSSVLKAIALLMATPSVRLKVAPVPRDIINRHNGAKRASVKAWFSHAPDDPVELFIEGASKKFPDGRFRQTGKLPRTTVLAYGATRLPDHDSTKRTQRSRVQIYNLFNAWIPIANPESFFANTSKVKSKHFNLLVQSLIKLLDLDPPFGEDEARVTIARRAGQLFLTIPGSSPVPLRDQSYGYQAMVALTADIVQALSRDIVDMESATGIVLIDELGCHLHPRWRIQIVETLREIFPRVQFIVSTHEPLCLRGAGDGEITRIFRKGAEISVVPLTPPLGLSADQMLTGQWFGLPTTLDTETLEMLEEHRKMLVDNVSVLSSERFQLEEELRERLSPRTFGGSEVETLARQAAADEIEKLGKTYKTLKVDDFSQLKENIRQSLANSKQTPSAGTRDLENGEGQEPPTASF